MRLFHLLFCYTLSLLFSVAQPNIALEKQADSLRLCGFYKQELLLREKINREDFNYQLASINCLLADNNAAQAYSLLQSLRPTSELATYWYKLTFSKYYIDNQELDKASSLLVTIAASENPLLQALVLFRKSQVASRKRDHTLTIELLEKATHLLDKGPYRNHFQHAQILSDLAFVYDEVGMRHKTIPTAERALRIVLNHYPRHVGTVNNFHNNVIFYVIEYGDARVAHEFQKSHQQYMSHFLQHKYLYVQEYLYEDVHAQALYHLSNIRYYSFTKDTHKIVEELKALEQHYQQAPLSWKEENLNILSASYESVQYTFRQLKDFPSALQYAASIDQVEKRPYNLMKKHAAYALTYYDAQENQLAYQHITKCIQVFEFPKGSKSLQTLMVLKAELLARLGKQEEAERHLQSLYDEILEQEGIDYFSIDIAQYPQHINKVFLNVLIHSGWIYQDLYRQRGNRLEDFKLSRHFFTLAAEVFEIYYQKDFYNKSLANIIAQIEDGLYFEAHLLTKEELTNNINLVEQFKDANLWKKFTSKYLENLNLPPAALEHKNQLQLQRNLLTRTYSEEISNQKKVDSIDHLLKQVEQSINTNNPEYAQFSSSQIDIKQLQKQLPPHKALVRYSHGENFVYAHVITAHTITLTKIAPTTLIKELVDHYLASIKNIRPDYLDIQQQLNQLLIKPLNLTGIKSIHFINEGFLSHVPFETLLAPSVVVSYQYSLKSAFAASLVKNTSSQNVVGFAPTYATDSTVASLHFTLSELASIHDKVPKSLLHEGENANKNQFLTSLGKFLIYHFAMHSIVDEEDYELSSLVFQNQEKLYFHELYSLNFPAELVVLSACNTAIGPYLDGEGVMSLARALHYAGVNASITSLWPVPDKESADLMKLFYEYITLGLSKDVALAQAKLKFQEHYPMKSHPYYWAGYILTGSTTPVPLQTSSAPIYWTVALLLGIGSIYWFQRKYR